MTGPAYHGRTHTQDGTDPIPGLNTGIQFDTDNVGGWLDVHTTGTDGSGHGIKLYNSNGGVDILVQSAGGITLDSQSAAMTFASDGGFLFGGAGDWTANTTGSFLLQSATAGETGSLFGADRLHLGSNNKIDLQIGTGSGDVVQVFGGSTELLRVTGNGTFHIKSGAAWVADL